MQVWFEVCRCPRPREPHGYFYDLAKGKCHTPTLSIESGELALKGIAESRRLSTKETNEISAQLRAAGLPERCDTNERVAVVFVKEFFRT